MNIETRKLSFIQEFLKLQNEEMVINLEKLLHQQKAALFDREMKPMSIEKFTADIDESFNDAKKGQMTSADELKTKFRKWS